MVVFWGFSDSTGEIILNSLEAVYLSDIELKLSVSGIMEGVQSCKALIPNCL